MRFDIERLYELLPALYRIRDTKLGKQRLTDKERAQIAQLNNHLAALTDPNSEEARNIKKLLDKKQRGPLKAFLSVIAEQISIIEENLDQFYDDQFIETCSEWVVPYIADLIGMRGLSVFQDASFSQRAQVANTLAYRRRKGTAAVLEQLARDVTGWNANVVEYFNLLATTQYMNHIRDRNISMADLRSEEVLEQLNMPFDRTAHTVDVRRIEQRRGKHNIHNIGIFLWRINSYALTGSPAYRVDDFRYHFDALRRDLPIYNRPEPEKEITHLAEMVNVPMPVMRRVFNRKLDTYYGINKSVLITKDKHDVLLAETLSPAASPPAEKLSDIIRVCNLGDLEDAGGNVIGWSNMPKEKIAIDPVLGRIAFPEDYPPPTKVNVTYHYGFSAEMGGGEYGRAATFSSGLTPVVKVPSQKSTIQAALDELQMTGGVVEIENNEYYIETPLINIASGQKIELRAADGRRPILVIDGEINITGGNNAELSINGFLISGGRLTVPLMNSPSKKNQLRLLHLQHCTLLPGASPAIKTVAGQLRAPRLIVESPDTLIEIDKCIAGGIRAVDDAKVEINNSIVDATRITEVAYSGLSGDDPGAPLIIKNSTVIGKVYTFTMTLATNTIFMAGLAEFDTWKSPVIAERLQQGCVRFSYIPPGSSVPSKYNCQPRNSDDALRVQPVFTSLQYGHSTYCQLSSHCAPEISRSADDGAEMGAFHNLYQPQRVADLCTKLDEYLRFGLEAGIYYAS